MIECSQFKDCSAPLCPLDLKDDRWYPDEQICNKSDIEWIKVQRKIEKKVKDREKYFTLTMLKQNCKIGSAISGIDPEKDEQLQIEKWIKKHPAKRILPESVKVELSGRMESVKAS